MTVLLIGGTGILSSAVTSQAKKAGIKVTMINRGRRKLPTGVEVIVSDNKNYEYIGEKLAGRHFDAVIDFLCYKPYELEDSFNLYSKLTDQYFYISSCAVYDTTIPGPYEEDSKKVRAEWPYSVEKWQSEELLAKLAKNSPCKYTIIRPCLTYGDTRLPYGIVPEFRKHWTFVARVLAGKPILRWNKGENRWNMMRVEDFAVGVVGLIGNSAAHGEAFNICGDETPSNNDVLKAIALAVGKEPNILDVTPEFYAEQFPWIAGEIIGGRAANLVCSNAKIKKAVPEFKQVICLNEGVAKTIAAYRDESFQLGIDWVYDARTDRAVVCWNRQHKCGNAHSLGFVNYERLGGLAQFRQYWQIRLQGSRLGWCLSLPFRVVGRLKRIIRR